MRELASQGVDPVPGREAGRVSRPPEFLAGAEGATRATRPTSLSADSGDHGEEVGAMGKPAGGAQCGREVAALITGKGRPAPHSFEAGQTWRSSRGQQRFVQATHEDPDGRLWLRVARSRDSAGHMVTAEEMDAWCVEHRAKLKGTTHG